MNYKEDIFLFLDIDGVLATTRQFNTNRKKWHPAYDCYRFDEKCVKVFNEIIEIIKPVIILSSDWKVHYDLNQMNDIFNWNDVQCTIADKTPSLWNVDFKKLQQLEECRASEIIKYVKKYDVEKFMAIDDLNLSPWLETNFIRTRINEGIKQSGIKEKILNVFNDMNKKNNN